MRRATARSLVAAAAPLTGPGALPLAQYTRARQSEVEWQQAAWAYYDDVPEVNFAHRFLANVSSRCRLLPQWQPSSAEPPTPLDPDDLTLDEQTRKLAAIAASVLERHGITTGADLVGGFAAWEASQLAVVSAEASSA